MIKSQTVRLTTKEKEFIDYIRSMPGLTFAGVYVALTNYKNLDKDNVHVFANKLKEVYDKTA